MTGCHANKKFGAIQRRASEVSELSVEVFIQKDVVTPQIPRDNPRLVNIIEGLCNLSSPFQPPRAINGALLSFLN
jgi:hypothetical protein